MERRVQEFKLLGRHEYNLLIELNKGHRHNLRVKERVEVLLCLSFINEERMRDIEQAGAVVNQQT